MGEDESNVRWYFAFLFIDGDGHDLFSLFMILNLVIKRWFCIYIKCNILSVAVAPVDESEGFFLLFFRRHGQKFPPFCRFVPARALQTLPAVVPVTPLRKIFLITCIESHRTFVCVFLFPPVWPKVWVY